MATINENLTIRGRLVADELVVPDGSIGNEKIDPADPIAADNQEHQYNITYQQPHGAAVVDQRAGLYIARGAGVVARFCAACVVPNVGDSTITIDLRKDGVSVLSALIELDSSQVAFAVVDGGFTSSPLTYTADDVFEVVVNATVGTGTLGQGLVVSMVVTEDES